MVALPRGRRRGMTMVELLLAVAIMAMVAGTMGILARGMQQSYQYTQGYGTATQHARVVLERIERTIREATTSDEFPGAIAVAEMVDAWRFPEILVVWHPSGDPVDPDGLPRFNELVIYCPNLNAPNQLIELTVPSDGRIVPPVTNRPQWRAEIGAIRQTNAGNSISLSELVRTCAVEDAAAGSVLSMAAVRFETRLRPSQDEWDDYQNGDVAWEDLAWVQGICGSQTGMRQVWVRAEVQLTPQAASIAEDSATNKPVPFFGSESINYELHR